MPATPGHHNLRLVPLFSGLSDRALDDLSRVSIPRRFRGGTILCSEGDPGEVLYVLEQGELRVSRITADGREIVIAVVDAPAALGELSLLDGGPRSATLTAQGDVQLRFIPRSAFLQLLTEQPAMRDAIFVRLAGILRNANQLHVDLLSLDVPGRLAKWLIQRSQRVTANPDGNNAFALGRSQSDLANQLGTTRSTLNRALRGFVELGLIEYDGDQIVVLDIAGLTDFTN